MLDTAVTGGVPKSARGSVKAGAREALPLASPLRRDLTHDLGEDFAPRRSSVGQVGARIQEDEDFVPGRGFGGLRFLVRGIPKSVVGRVLAGGVVLAVLGAVIAGMWELRSMLLSNSRLVPGVEFGDSDYGQ